MAVTKTTILESGRVATEDLADQVRTKVAKHGDASSGHHVETALALHGEPRGVRVSRLWGLVSGGVADRMARILDIMDTLRRELPDILARSPLKLSHLGFSKLEDLVAFIGEALFYMETGAASRAEFVAGLKGWRWNLVGRVLFERLVKRHPRLDGFFRRLADDLVTLVNAQLRDSRRALVDIGDTRRSASPTFGRPQKVMEFRMVGADGKERAFTDFGFLSRNREGWWVILPIELKLPSALSGVAEQFSDFVRRLKEGGDLIAVIERGGKLVAEPIDPRRLLFMTHDRAQVVVAPLAAKAAADLLGTDAARQRSVDPNDVASVVEFKPQASVTHEVQYYRIRLLVVRDWLADLIRPLTDPPQPR